MSQRTASLLLVLSSLATGCAVNASANDTNESSSAQALTSDAPCGARISEIALGSQTSYALAHDGTVYAWGSNNFGALGGGDMYSPSAAPSPVKVPLASARHIAAGASGACAVLEDTSVWCWGLQSEDGFGPAFWASPQAMQTITGPTTTAPLTGAVGVAAGEAHACAWKKDGTVWCWGNDNFGESGDPSLTTVAYAATQVAGIDDAVHVVASVASTCVLRRSGDVMCFGTDADGELGNGTVDDFLAYATPSIVALGAKAHALYGGGQGTFCAATERGPKCWGWNRRGVAGTGVDSPAVASPASIDAHHHARLAFGGAAACSWTHDAGGACWGYGASGQLANGGADSLVPVPLSVGRAIDQIAIGDRHACALEGGEVTCWGDNDAGQLGIGATSSGAVPPTRVRF
jgi:alpha-tubulin suppressor-like RCC1 family protein